MERKRDEIVETKKELANTKVKKANKIKDQKDRFRQGFLEREKNHPSDPSGSGKSVHTPLPRPNMTRKSTTSSGIANSVDNECKKSALMGVLAGANKLKCSNCTQFRNGGDCPHRRQVSTHTDPLEARDMDGKSFKD